MEEANQINVVVSRATAAAEEAQGKGSVDGLVEVQEATESSGPVQPKSLKGPASDYNSDIRHRYGSKDKPKLEQVVIEVNLDSSTDGYLASKQAAEIAGVVSVELGGPDRNLLEVIGEGVDAVHLVNFLRKMFGNAKLMSPGPVKEPMKDVMEEKPILIKEGGKEPALQPPVPPSIPLHPISKSAVDTAETTKLNGAMEMETKTNTHSNLSLENAESSCKTKTAEWTLLITSLLLEAISAIFDQLGYALTSMVMAFVALLLSMISFTRLERREFHVMGGACCPVFIAMISRIASLLVVLLSTLDLLVLSGNAFTQQWGITILVRSWIIQSKSVFYLSFSLCVC